MNSLVLLIFCFLSLPIRALSPLRDEMPPLVMTISMPKSGTHLISNLVAALTNLPGKWGDTHTIIDEAKIKKFGSSRFYTSHAPYTDLNRDIVERNKMKVIFIMRDPRDVIVSYAYWAKKDPFANVVAHRPDRSHPYANAHLMMRWSVSDFITHFIDEYPFKGPLLPPYKTIVDFHKLYLPWQNMLNCYVTTFEKLVGPRGGGDQQMQQEEIMNIAYFLGRAITPEQAQKVATKIFVGTGTFREGQRGSWKKIMNQKQVSSLREMEGFNTLLIDLKYETNVTWEKI